MDSNHIFRHNVIIREKKTSKKNDVYISSAIKEALTLYLSTRGNYELSEYLFLSGHKKHNKEGMMEVRSYSRLLREAGRVLGLKERLGSHTPRKTGVRMHIQDHPDEPLTAIMMSDMLNHSSLKTTYRYADITKTEREIFLEKNPL